MYNVRNVCGRDLAIQLEKGGVILRPNKCVDLDQRCSRKWINANFDIRKLITKGFLQVTHDSRAVLPKAPVRPVVRAQPMVAIASRIVSNKPVEIVDLVSFPDVEINDTGRLSVMQPEPEVFVTRVEPITVPDLPVFETLAPQSAAPEVVPEFIPEVVPEVVEVVPEVVLAPEVVEVVPAEVAGSTVVEVVPDHEVPVEIEKPEKKSEEVEKKSEEVEKKSEEASVYGGFEFNRSSARKKKSRR